MVSTNPHKVVVFEWGVNSKPRTGIPPHSGRFPGSMSRPRAGGTRGGCARVAGLSGDASASRKQCAVGCPVDGLVWSFPFA